MEREARAWGMSLEFVSLPATDLRVRLRRMPGGFDSGESMGVSEWVDLVSPELGWISPGAFLTELQLRDGIDHAHVLLLIRRTGRSYASSNQGNDAFDALPFAACYLDPRESAVGATTVAHETLHLYGAWDLYHSPYHTRTQAEHAARLFPADIMFGTSREIDSLSVGDVTAWRLGWIHSGPEWFEFFAPSGDRGQWRTAASMVPPRRHRSRRPGVTQAALSAGRPITDFLARASAGLRVGIRRPGAWLARLIASPSGAAMGAKGPAGRSPAPPTHPAGSATVVELLARIDRFRQHDPWNVATISAFVELRSEVLAACGVRHADEIARKSCPAVPRGLRGGRSNPQYQALNLEHGAIRLHVKRLGAAGVVEEDRLDRILAEWRTILECPGLAASQRAQTDPQDCFRTCLHIIDSIARRNTAELRAAVFRFEHLRRQIGA